MALTDLRNFFVTIASQATYLILKCITLGKPVT